MNRLLNYALSVYASSDSVSMISLRGKIAIFLEMLQTLQKILATILRKKLVTNLRLILMRFQNSFIMCLVFRYELAL